MTRTKHLFAACLLVLGLSACDQPQPGDPVIRTDISGEKGKEIARADDSTKPAPSPSPTATPSETATPEDSACKPVRFEDVMFTECVADPARHRVRMVLGSPPYRSLAKFSASRPENAPPVAFAMNAGMFHPDYRPVGLLVIDGQELHPITTQAGGGDAAPHGLAGHLRERGDLGGDLPDRDGGGRVAVPALDDGTAVDGDDVTLGEHPLPGDAVHDLVVDRGADRPREAVVALEGRHGTAGADVVLGDRVELGGADAGADRGAQQLQGLPHDQAGATHQPDLVAVLDLQAAVEQSHVVPVLVSRARRRRAR